jgi:hypothetical protein
MFYIEMACWAQLFGQHADKNVGKAINNLLQRLYHHPYQTDTASAADEL